METIKFICLANSRKLRGRCIAGLRLDGGGWIRPVSDSPDGTLYQQHYQLQYGSAPKLLDLIEVDFVKARPEKHQPENYLISNRKWRLLERPAHMHISFIKSHLSSGPYIFGDNSDRIKADLFAKNPAKNSLILVQPTNLEWIIEEKYNNKKFRVFFTYNNCDYNLAVTDPFIEKRLISLAVGTYYNQDLGFQDNDDILFTISLGEPFGEPLHCYKLVAAVINLNNILKGHEIDESEPFYF